MARRTQIVVGALVLAVLLLGAGGIAGFFGVREYRRAASLQSARASFETGDWQTASDQLSRYLPHDPANIELLTMYANANARILDDRPAALRNVAHAYHQILRYDPQNEDAQSQLLQLYERQGAWDVLEYYAADWLRKQPDHRDLLRARATALDKSGSRDDAIAAYEALFAQHPGRYDELGRYAVLLRERSGDDAAEGFLEGRIKEHPNDADALTAAAQYWLTLGDVESAKHYLALAQEAAPDAEGHTLLRARIAGSERRWDDALALLDALPADAETVAIRANVLLARGNPDDAVALLAQAPIETRIDHPRLQILLTDTLYGLDRADQARAEADAYLHAYPLDTSTRNYVNGRQALSEERYADAANALAVAVEMRPDFRAARLALAAAHIAAGDSAAGRGVLEAYLREQPADEQARAIWTAHFGIGEREAERIAAQGDTNADPKSLLAAVSVMTEAALREGDLANSAQAIATLAQRAAALSPDAPEPYRFEIGVWLRIGAFDQAKQVAERAAQTNLDPVVRNELNGTIALAENDIQRAKNIYESIRGQLDAEGHVAWARRFAAAGDYTEAVSMLDAAEFALDRLELAAEFAPLDDAWNAMSNASNLPNAERLNRARLVLTARIADAQGPDRESRLNALAESAANADDAYALAVRAATQPSAEAEATLKEAERRAPGDPLILDRLRGHYETELRYDTALTYAERATAADPANDRYRFALGKLQAMNGLTAQAERTIRDVLSRAPANNAARQLLIQTLLDAGRIDAAEAALADLPEDQHSDRLRSRVLIAQKAHAAAEALVRARLDEAPGDRAARWDLAACLRETGRTDEAVQLLQDATQRDDIAAEDWTALARFHAQDDTDTALDAAAGAALRALLIDPEHAEALRLLAGVRERQNDPAAALAVLRRYTDARPDDAAAWYRRAQLELASGGQWSAALASVEKAYAIDALAEYRALRGYIHAGMHHYADAIADLEEAAADLPATTVQFDLTLADCYLQTDRLEQAELRITTAERKAAQQGSAENDRLAALKAALAERKAAQ